MPAEVGVIGFNAVLVKIICPYRIECVTEALGKTQGHTSSPGKSIDQTEPFALACKLAFRPAFVNTLFLSDETLIIRLDFWFIYFPPQNDEITRSVAIGWIALVIWSLFIHGDVSVVMLLKIKTAQSIALCNISGGASFGPCASENSRLNEANT